MLRRREVFESQAIDQPIANTRARQKANTDELRQRDTEPHTKKS